MSEKSQSQVESWLKKLERESWQLELLVSAFTIFLLIGANSSYTEFLESLPYRYNMVTPAFAVGGLFFLIIKNSIQALTISLIVHLMLRGFWIGTIGLRSVQPSVDFDKLNYSDFFTKKLKNNGVISLDKMVVQLDEICSVIFAFSFLVISVLLAFAMYLVTLGFVGFSFSQLINLLPGVASTIMLVITVVFVIAYFFMGIIYMIDYLTLGFFKKLAWFARFYYPFYRLFNIITLSRLSKSIYYYLISKFSKNRIRIVFAGLGTIVLLQVIFEFDQFTYYPSSETDIELLSNFYEDERPSDEFIESVSIPSRINQGSFVPLFIRYNPMDNKNIKGNCPDFEPLKDDGINSKFGIKNRGGGFNITTRDYSSEDVERLLACQASIYRVTINDSLYAELNYRFYEHPGKGQKGILAMINSDGFDHGENVLKIEKVATDSVMNETLSPFVQVPFWFTKN